MNITITKRDGTREPFNADRINRSIERACRGLTDPVSMVTQIASETQLTLYDGITTEEMDRATIDAAVQNISYDIEYDKVATRLLLKTIYRKVIGEFDLDNYTDLRQRHQDGFVSHIEKWVEDGLLDPRMKNFDLEALASTLDIDRDNIFVYAGLSTLADRYTLKSKDGSIGETPQYFFMRIAMGLSYNEKNPTEAAKKFYNKLSRHEYIAGGSTNIGAGTNNPALANCFLIQVEDDMAHIAKSVSDVMVISKATGGIGLSVTKLRATGSILSSTNTKSSGPTPFAKIMDTAIRAIVRGGKKMGALCLYMENWHYDFPEFIDWKHNAGDDYMRMRTANTAAYISDEFMKRVHQGDTWYFFDPKETPDLIELYGSAFSKRYQQYVDKAEQGEIKMWKKMPARELFRKMLVSLQTTSHPWITWKDTINLRALNNNTGTIHMSNLCTEICLPQDKENIAVCNLASINLAAHITHREINWPRLEETVRTAVRHLDNLIDINVLPIKEATNSDINNRAVGLGVMGFTDTLEQLGMAYDSEHAWDFADRIFEFISYMAIDESANLSEERGSYKNFEGSGWSKGMVPVDTLEHLEADRKVVVAIQKDSKHKGLDWNVLRAKVKKGMRNATLMAVAPNANIGLVAGTTPGMDPRFAQIFSRNKFSGKYVDINHNLVKDLKNLGIWNEVRDQVLANRGDISEIDEIPQHIRNVYKTSFSTSPYAFIEVAARANKWIDQAISRNMYLETRDIDETMKIYSTAWGKGVKTTYYLHMKPRHSAEQSTIRVNKGEKIGRIGFGGLGATAKPEVKVEEKQKVQSPFAHVSTPEESVPVMATTNEEKQAVSGKGFGAVMVAHHITSAESNVVENMADPVIVSSVGFKGFGEARQVPSGIPISQSEASTTQTVTPQLEKKSVDVINTNNVSNVCPIDPAERAQCDSCQ